MQLKPLGNEVRTCFVTCPIRDRKSRACTANYRFVPLYQLENHFLCGRNAFGFRNGSEFRELPIRSRSRKIERANSLRNQIYCGRQLNVLLLKHEVKGLKHGPGD